MLDADFWHFSLTSLVPLGLSPVGVADPLGQGRRRALRCPPPPHTHLDSAPSAILPGKAAAGPRARAPCPARARRPFPSSPAQPGRREGAEWGVVGALGRLLRVPAEAAAAGAAETAAAAGVPLPSLTSGFWP